MNLNYLHQIRKGEKSAFNSLFKQYYQKLCQMALIVTCSEELAQEAVQQFFIHIWENRESIRNIENEKAYLYRSVYNQALQVIKKQKKQTYTEQHFAFNAPKSWQPEDRIQWENFRPYIEEAINNLPTKCRHIFLLKRIEGLTNSEIADYLQISEKTVENQVTIAIKKLRQQLQPLMNQLPVWYLFSQFFD